MALLLFLLAAAAGTQGKRPVTPELDSLWIQVLSGASKAGPA